MKRPCVAAACLAEPNWVRLLNFCLCVARSDIGPLPAWTLLVFSCGLVDTVYKGLGLPSLALQVISSWE